METGVVEMCLYLFLTGNQIYSNVQLVEKSTWRIYPRLATVCNPPFHNFHFKKLLMSKKNDRNRVGMLLFYDVSVQGLMWLIAAFLPDGLSLFNIICVRCLLIKYAGHIWCVCVSLFYNIAATVWIKYVFCKSRLMPLTDIELCHLWKVLELCHLTTVLTTDISRS